MCVNVSTEYLNEILWQNICDKNFHEHKFIYLIKIKFIQRKAKRFGSINYVLDVQVLTYYGGNAYFLEVLKKQKKVSSNK